MKISRQDVAQRLIDYLKHRITLSDLVDWAESAMMEADFDHVDYDTLRDIISRIGLADVRAFGMDWENCEDYLSRLGYQVKIEISKNQAVA